MIKKMKVLAIELQTGKKRIFNTIEEASNHYKISIKKIKSSIELGHKWRGLYTIMLINQ